MAKKRHNIKVRIHGSSGLKKNVYLLSFSSVPEAAKHVQSMMARHGFKPLRSTLIMMDGVSVSSRQARRYIFVPKDCNDEPYYRPVPPARRGGNRPLVVRRTPRRGVFFRRRRAPSTPYQVQKKFHEVHVEIIKMFDLAIDD